MAAPFSILSSERPLVPSTVMKTGPRPHISYLSRRAFIHGCALTAAGAATSLLTWADAAERLANVALRGRSQRTLTLDGDWLFGGKLDPAALKPDFYDASLSRITLPHTVVPLSWKDWNPSSWENVWLYRRHFQIPAAMQNLRLFLHFDRIMAGAQPVLNGHALPQHLGGFLPFEYEVTHLLRAGDNVLAVSVDSRWLNAPPSGSPQGPKSIDYLLPGGITGSASLHAVPRAFLRDVFAKPVNMLDQDRRLELLCRVDADIPFPAAIRLAANLQQDGRTIASVTRSASLEKSDQEIHLALGDLKGAPLWDVATPRLCDLVVTLFLDDQPVHDYRLRVGLRDARFTTEGFFLNGQRLQLFGLDRHELFPYVGFAAPPRIMRHDAELLRHSYNCNIVRCSHYPQSEAFLDRCDELGLLVWDELPGWQYIGNEQFQSLAVRDVSQMVLRDRNHPSVVIWGVRINESPNDPDLYRRTRAVAKSLDDSRPTSGTMTPSSKKTWREEWHQDVFAFDDYHSAPDGSVGIDPPVAGYPYLITETVGQFDYATGKGFDNIYRRAGDPAEQSAQALYHAEAHDRAANYPRCSGAIAWCAFDYGSLMNAWQAVKCPGIADVFRIPKLGASFYLGQTDPSVRAVIEPNFYWDFGPRTPQGPGQHAAIFSNCDRLELFFDGTRHRILHPARNRFPNLKHPPFFADLSVGAAAKPVLRIDGYSGGSLVLTRSFSADRSHDHLWLHADDHELDADGADATSLAFGVVDRFGSPRAFADGEIALTLHGPGVLVGDNPFQLADSGGLGAVWVRTMPGRTGTVKIAARHSSLGTASETIAVRPASTWNA